MFSISSVDQMVILASAMERSSSCLHSWSSVKHSAKCNYSLQFTCIDSWYHFTRCHPKNDQIILFFPIQAKFASVYCFPVAQSNSRFIACHCIFCWAHPSADFESNLGSGIQQGETLEKCKNERFCCWGGTILDSRWGNRRGIVENIERIVDGIEKITVISSCQRRKVQTKINKKSIKSFRKWVKNQR